MSKLGRPKIFNVNSDKVVGIRLTPDAYRKLEKQAEKSKAGTISGYARKLILEKLEQKNGGTT